MTVRVVVYWKINRHAVSVKRENNSGRNDFTFTLSVSLSFTIYRHDSDMKSDSFLMKLDIMKPCLVFYLLLLGSSFGTAAEIPASIINSEWDYQAATGVRSGVPSASEKGKIVSFPKSIWTEVGRQIILVPTDTASAKRMRDDKTWGSFLFSHIQSLDQLITCQFSDLPESDSITELKPIPTPEQGQFLKNIVNDWLLPLPEAFAPVGDGRAVMQTWNVTADQANARIKVLRRSVPRNRDGKGGTTEIILWHDNALSDGEAVINILAEDFEVEISKRFGHMVMWRNWQYSAYATEQFEWFYWPSGHFIVSLQIPKAHVSDVVKSYLKRYPPTWNDEVNFEKAKVSLSVLNRSLIAMEQNKDGPLEYLRYSFRVYSFDKALLDAVHIIPRNGENGGGIIRKQHFEAVDAIQTAWASTPADAIKLSDYLEAMLKHRSALINKLTTIRDRIQKFGYKRDENKFTVYGDTP